MFYQQFYSLAWTTVDIPKKSKTNLLAVGGTWALISLVFTSFLFSYYLNVTGCLETDDFFYIRFICILANKCWVFIGFFRHVTFLIFSRMYTVHVDLQINNKVLHDFPTSKSVCKIRDFIFFFVSHSQCSHQDFICITHTAYLQINDELNFYYVSEQCMYIIWDFFFSYLGHNGHIKLLHPDQLVCYKQLGNGRPNRACLSYYISCVMFHPTEKSWLFSKYLYSHSLYCH